VTLERHKSAMAVEGSRVEGSGRERKEEQSWGYTNWVFLGNLRAWIGAEEPLGWCRVVWGACF
jgi:hypothetical protein